jgi:hypothetical protein
MARSVFQSALETRDELCDVGYPRSHEPLVAVVRGGRILAVAHFTGSEEAGLLPTKLEMCSEFTE